MNAWTDAAVVAELVKDCAWTPPGEQGSSSALSCEIEVEQTCNYNECDALEEQCRPGCISTCNGCADGCRTSCAACKTACRDASCKRACAESCGSCRQKCLKDKDHCATGVCGAAASACGTKLLEDYQKSGCAKKVPQLQTCIEACLNDVLKQSPDAGFMQNIECQNQCENQVMPSCTRYHSHYRVF